MPAFSLEWIPGLLHVVWKLAPNAVQMPGGPEPAKGLGALTGWSLSPHSPHPSRGFPAEDPLQLQPASPLACSS